MPAPSSLPVHHALWRGEGCAQVSTPSVPTGFAELDVLLPGHGWPTEALTEIYAERRGIGEMQMLMPAFSRLTRHDRWVSFIAPPYIPYAPALTAHGVRLSRFMWIQPPDIGLQLWACEQALRAGSAGAVLLWLDRIQDRSLRRIQHAAEGSGAMVLLFRAAKSAPFSASALRIHLSKDNGRTIVRILKRRGGGTPAPVLLDLHGAFAHPIWKSPQRSYERDAVYTVR
jgi:hypothetical protein